MLRFTQHDTVCGKRVRLLMRAASLVLAAAGGIGTPVHGEGRPEVIDLGSRRELFVDTFLIEGMENTSLRLHHPVSAGAVLTFDRAWEGEFCAYITILKDEGNYLMYYRGLSSVKGGAADHRLSTEVTCRAVSNDGVNWTKPDLGLFEVGGTKENNVVWANSRICHNFCPFIDTKPGIPVDERFKAIGGNRKTGLFLLVSGDGIHWKLWSDTPILTGGAYDSQNVMFYSPAEEQYVCYFRVFEKVGDTSYRRISRTTSKDLEHWSEPVSMRYSAGREEHYYTNQTHPYFRAPHIYVALAARFMRGRQAISAERAREIGVVGNYFGDCSDVILMTSRGGDLYHRTFPEGFVRPGRGWANWTSRTNYSALGVVPTGPAEMSLYVQRHYAQRDHHLERLTLRTDGFISIHAPYGGGAWLSKPLRFDGNALTLNYATSAAGSIRVELLDEEGTPLDGRSASDCDIIFGDELERTVTWNGRSDLQALSGKIIRLRFEMDDADLYSVRFTPRN